MKKTDWFILATTAAYSYLFYQQAPGINYFLFSILLIILCLAPNTSLLRRPAWVAAAAGTLLSGFAVFFLGTGLTIYANIASLLLLAAFSLKPESSLFIALLNSYYTLMMTVPTMILNATKVNNETTKTGTSKAKRFVLILLPVAVAIIFLFLYRASNPLFERVTDEINLDFISVEWMLFTLFGFLLMVAFFRQQAIEKYTGIDKNSPDQLSLITEEEHLKGKIAAMISLPNELFTGIILLALLNVLLIFVNGTDIYFIYIIGKLPEGLSLSQYLHDGTDSLIVSIVLAISIMLFYFRGRLNFVENNRTLRLLAYGWILQNIFMVATTAHRNYDYIANFGLTHKRIGVYIFLSLCIIGLITTFLKVYRIRSNWFIFRKNTWVWYTTLVIAAPVNWDAIIANYNLTLAQNKNAHVDSEYLAELSYTALPVLFNFYSAEKHTSVYSGIFDPILLKKMNSGYSELYGQVTKGSWQSTCITRALAKEHIVSLYISPMPVSH